MFQNSRFVGALRALNDAFCGNTASLQLLLFILPIYYVVGNVEFVQSPDGSLKVYGEKELVSSAVLLGLSSRMLREVLLAGNPGNGKKSRVGSPGQINITLRSLNRALYTRLLGAVLRRINEQLQR